MKDRPLALASELADAHRPRQNALYAEQCEGNRAVEGEGSTTSSDMSDRGKRPPLSGAEPRTWRARRSSRPTGHISAGVDVGWLGDRTRLHLRAGEIYARAIVYMGQRLHEPTVQYGPFVAGSIPAIEDAYRRFRHGDFTLVSELK